MKKRDIIVIGMGSTGLTTLQEKVGPEMSDNEVVHELLERLKRECELRMTLECVPIDCFIEPLKHVQNPKHTKKVHSAKTMSPKHFKTSRNREYRVKPNKSK